MNRISDFIECHHGWFACAGFVGGAFYIIVDAFK